MDGRPRIPGWISALLVGLILLLPLATLAVGLCPLSECPKCLGRGLNRLIDPQGPPDVRGVTFQPVRCNYCSDRKVISLFKSWRWRPEDAPQAPIFRN